MDAQSEKLCLGELDHLILDVGKKATLTYVSNNWLTTSKNAEDVLKKWLKNHSDNKRIVKEYLIRGTDVRGNSIVTVVSEKDLSKIDEICPNHIRTLYSVEIGSENGKSLNIPEPSTNKYVALKINYDKRNMAVNKIVVPPQVKKEPEVAKKPANFFGAAQSKCCTVKNESNTANNSKDVNVKEEKTSPKKSPRKNQSAAKPSAKAPPGKSSSSIASFFGSKPSASKLPSTHDRSVSDAATKIEKVNIKDETAEHVKNETANTNKRQHPNTSDSAEDTKMAVKSKKIQAKKKMKLEPKSARSRVMQICDSSSDEDEVPDKKDVEMECDTEPTTVKKEKENKTPSPDKNKLKAGSTDSRKRRVKIKKKVTRTYEDEDGFINTVHEVEEVSCSEDEPEVVEPPPKKVASAASSTGASVAPASKKKISPPAGKKQGSILSFFGKK